MSSTIAVAAGGFRFVPGVYQYSAGVAAEPGFRIERALFAEPVPLAEPRQAGPDVRAARASNGGNRRLCKEHAAAPGTEVR